MKKVYPSTTYSSLICRGCSKKKIKANLVHKKCILGNADPHSLLCYSCYNRIILQPRRENSYEKPAI